MKYGYVVFDMDGTLIDTCEAIQQSLRDTIVMLTGKTPAKAEMRATFGKLQSAELALGEGLVVSPPLGVSLLVQAARAKTRARDRTSSGAYCSGAKISKSTRIRRGRFPACGSLWTGLRREAAG